MPRRRGRTDHVRHLDLAARVQVVVVMDDHLFWDNYRCCGRLSLLRVPFRAVTGEYRRRCRHCRRSWVVSLICTQLDPFRIDTIRWRERETVDPAAEAHACGDGCATAAT